MWVSLCKIVNPGQDFRNCVIKLLRYLRIDIQPEETVRERNVANHRYAMIFGELNHPFRELLLPFCRYFGRLHSLLFITERNGKVSWVYYYRGRFRYPFDDVLVKNL